MKAFYTLLILLIPFIGFSQSNISCSPQLTQNIITCNDSILLEAGDDFDSYLWSTGENSSSIIVNESGNYNVSVFCNDTINLRVFKEQEGLISTMQGVLDYQSENPLTDRLLIMDSEIISNSICENLETLLNNIDVALFTSQANFYNCNWIDIIPVLDDFMRNGGTVIILGDNDGGLGFIDSSPNGNWPDYYTDYISQDLADDWFNNLIVDDYQYEGLAVVNENCANGQLLFNNSFQNNILFNNVYDYPNGNVGSNCNMMLYNPVGYTISESDLSDDNFFSIYKYQENSVEGAIEFGNNDQIVLGKLIGSGELILYGDKQPNNSPFDGSRNLLGNIIHYFSIEPTSQANINVTINPNQVLYATDTQVHCDTYTWIDGNTYTESNNTATFTLTNSNNCDSIVTLDLIINNSDNTSSSVTACDEFTWDGQTYTESGEYINTYTNANGCDSTHTLNLIINNSISSNTEASSCSSYEWNGMIYENSGTYEFDTIASNGCDSTAVLELEICYLDQLDINGPTAAVTSTTSSFSVQENAGSIYEWSLSNELGEISSGQNSNEINVDWSTDEGLITICVLEKYDCSGLECLGDTICLEVELKRPAGVVENNLEVNIYPNPSSNIFNLKFSSNSETEILVTNILGEQIYFESVKSIGDISTQIDLSDYSKGVYNLSIRTSDNISNHKLILQ